MDRIIIFIYKGTYFLINKSKDFTVFSLLKKQNNSFIKYDHYAYFHINKKKIEKESWLIFYSWRNKRGSFSKVIIIFLIFNYA